MQAKILILRNRKAWQIAMENSEETYIEIMVTK